ncbi:class II aldolase/adducin family protein [Glaciimonas sp. CA11.2]|uniref:class II aldolase/adducin family protein n=1 Tax=unclassified Glaciimonas TaxID=2644401 RepID=UPI002AB40FA0|nr:MULTISPECIES: class II aldolase/adducin family protein [unclassified Glaciimonas]MDY7545196.1 class II aldolase/adducin family protein [Glaciimonas sp. CA11.2]MEB0011305.1 class II aldolase/adducin family protein [Glaciimonas sp. Cout2]MEB0080955.1 class II aldolase/adducin family protein [Glaciimonas sp. Gout2]MEB0162451.1 class II aldolase/adducin family protein [Glaciimonas sp. CA11.2]
MYSDLQEAISMRPEQVGEEEWEHRLKLAAFYRLVDWFGWTELIYNHITLRVTGPETHFLINPFGLHYCQVTASNLVKIDLAGNKVESSKYAINGAGFVIHSAIHAARDDAHCVIHTHTLAGSAVAGKQDGLRYDNLVSVRLKGRIAYHDFEGITTDESEQPRLVKSLGDKNMLILRTHGLLAIGHTVEKAFMNYWRLQRACELQMAMDALQGPNQAIPLKVYEESPMREASIRQPQPDEMPIDIFNAMLHKAGIHYQALV